MKTYFEQLQPINQNQKCSKSTHQISLRVGCSRDHRLIEAIGQNERGQVKET